MQNKNLTVSKNFMETSLSDFYSFSLCDRDGNLKVDHNKFAKDFFLNNDGSVLQRSYMTSTLILPVFLYLKENDLLKNIPYEYGELTYPAFLYIRTLIYAAGYDQIPSHMRFSLLMYLKTIPGFTYEMLNGEEEISDYILESQQYMQKLIAGTILRSNNKN